MNKNTIVLLSIAMLLVGGIIGYFVANANQPVTRQNMRNTVDIMQDSGGIMSQMAEMMESSADMMARKGEQYKDSELTQMGREIQSKAQSLNISIEEMIDKMNEMMRSMGQ